MDVDPDLRAVATPYEAATLGSRQAICALADWAQREGIEQTLQVECPSAGDRVEETVQNEDEIAVDPADVAPPDPDRAPVEKATVQPMVISADQAGYRTAQEAIATITGAAGGSEGCGEAYAASIDAEGSDPHGLSLDDPIPAAAIAVLEQDGRRDAAEYELRVLIPTGVIFVSQDSPAGSPNAFAAAVQVEQYRRSDGSGETFWESPEGAFWVQC